MKRLLLIAALFAVPCSLFAQMVTVTSSNLRTPTGMPVTGIITFTPLLANGVPGSYKAPSGGQVVAQPVSVSVTNGAFSISLPDVTLTDPPNICFSVTLKTGSGSGLGPGYGCLQPHATANGPNDWCQSGTCSFDRFVPQLTSAQTNFQAIPGTITDLPQILLRSAPETQTALTDAATITVNTGGSMFEAYSLTLNPGLLVRTLNAAGMATLSAFSLTLSPAFSTPPTPITTTIQGWSASTAVALGQVLWDPNGHLQEVVTAGYTGAAEPAWNASGAQTSETGGTGQPKAVWLDLGMPIGLQFGSGCTWQPSQNSGLASLANGIVIAPGSTSQIVLTVQYDGTNCWVAEVQ